MAQTYTTNLAQRVRQTCAEHGVTQVKLAAALGTSQAAVSRRHVGLVEWRPAELAVVAAMCGVEVADLLPATRAAA